MARTRLACLYLVTFLVCPALADVDANMLLFEARPLDADLAELATENPANHAGDLATPPAAGTFPASSTTLLADLAAYNASIAGLIESKGPFDLSLVQEHSALGHVYQTLGQHERAIEAFEEAEYISRINDGLTSPQAFDSIEGAVESYIALGDLESANEKLQFLLYLNREHYGANSLELVPLLATLGDWHMYSFNQAITAPPVATFSVQIGFGGGGGNTALNPRTTAFRSLFRAQNMYQQAIGTLLRNQIMSAPALLELEQKLVESVFLSAHREGLMRNPAFFLGSYYTTTGSHLRRSRFSGLSPSYLQGRNAYERMRSYLDVQYTSDPMDRAEILLAEADWHLIYDHHSKAIRVYHEALALMREHQVPPETVQDIFAPDLPVQLPAFTALPHSRAYLGIPEDESITYDGYIDISFELSRYGNASKIRVLDRSVAATGQVVKRLKRLLHSTPFRPEILEGMEHTRQKRLRYYFAELPLEEGS